LSKAKRCAEPKGEKIFPGCAKVSSTRVKNLMEGKHGRLNI
jgi:hypothetical protein